MVWWVLLCGFLVYLGVHAWAQSPWIRREYFVPTGIEEDKTAHGYRIPVLFNGRYVVLYIPSWVEDDSLRFWMWDLETQQRKHVAVYVPGISTTLLSPITCLADFRDSTLVMAFRDTVFLVVKMVLTEGRLQLQEQRLLWQVGRNVPLVEYLRLLSTGDTLLGRYYRGVVSRSGSNRSAVSDTVNVRLVLVDGRDYSIKRAVEPSVAGLS